MNSITEATPQSNTAAAQPVKATKPTTQRRKVGRHHVNTEWRHGIGYLISLETMDAINSAYSS
jgi:hypothetical protein